MDYNHGKWEYSERHNIIGQHLYSPDMRNLILRYDLRQNAKDGDFSLILHSPEMYEMLKRIETSYETSSVKPDWFGALQELITDIEDNDTPDIEEEKKQAMIESYPKMIQLLKDAEEKLRQDVDYKTAQKIEASAKIRDFLKEATKFG